MFKPTIPGEYNEPSIALESFVMVSKFLMCFSVKVGFKTYFISSRDESENI